MKVLKFIYKNNKVLSGFILLGFAMYLFVNNNLIMALISFLLALCMWQQGDISDLNKRVYDLEIKSCDLEVKLGKMKWGIKE